ncbi:MAG: DUF4388 domain-containing protein [Candidatus Omnitrophota bacterium]
MGNPIEKFPTTLILKRILKDNLSGELVFANDHFTKRLLFTKGQLVLAESTLKEDRLGDFLCREGRITPQQLRELEDIQQQEGEKIGKILVKHGMLDQKDIFLSLRNQAKAIATSLFAPVSGQWTFKMGKPTETEVSRFNLDLAEIMIEGSQKIDDFSYYKQRFNYRAPITLPISEIIGKLLSPEHFRFYFKLSKCDVIATGQIFSLMEMNEKTFWSQLVMLYLLGIIDFTDFRIDSKANQDLEKVEELHEKLKADAIDHYQLLELKDTASVNEVKDQYFAFTKKYSPESLGTQADTDAGIKVEYVMGKAGEAFETLTNEEKKKQYDTARQKTNPVLTEGHKKVSPQEKAKALYLKAHSLFEDSQYLDAVHLMDEAVGMDSSRPSYFLLLGLSQSRVPELHPQAEKSLQIAARMEPWNADPVFYLGQLYWSENLFKKAEREFRRALQINMEHTLALQMIEKIEKRFYKKPGFSLFRKK